jgi:hypothetical protein
LVEVILSWCFGRVWRSRLGWYWFLRKARFITRSKLVSAFLSVHPQHGDVFSAAFSYAWLVEDQEPLAAAWFASRVAAGYVESSRDRFTTEEIGNFQAQAREAYERHGAGTHRMIPESQIYLAGPFFSTAQQWLIDEVRAR